MLGVVLVEGDGGAVQELDANIVAGHTTECPGGGAVGALGEDAAVLKVDLDAVVGLGPAGLSLVARVSAHLDEGDEVLCLGAHDLFVAEGGEANLSVDDLGGEAVLHAELALKAAGGPGVDERAGRVEVDQDVDAVDVVGGEGLAAEELGGGV